MDELKAILTRFDVDFYMGVKDGHNIYVGRLWEEGNQVAESESLDLADLLRDLDKTAAAIANYG